MTNSEKAISPVCENEMSSQCTSVLWYGIGLDDEMIFDLAKRFVKGGVFKDAIEGLVSDTESESVEDLLENGYIDYESGRNFVANLASHYHLNYDNFFTSDDTDYYYIGIPLRLADGEESLIEIEAHKTAIQGISDDLGIKYGFYHGICWTDF